MLAYQFGAGSTDESDCVAFDEIPTREGFVSNMTFRIGEILSSLFEQIDPVSFGPLRESFEHLEIVEYCCKALTVFVAVDDICRASRH